MNRLYIPTIALVITFLFTLALVPPGSDISSPPPWRASVSLKSDVAAAEIICSDDEETADIKFTITKIIPERNTIGGPGYAPLPSDVPDPYVLVEKASFGIGIYQAFVQVFYFNGNEVGRFSSGSFGTNNFSFTSRTEGGILTDGFTSTSTGPWGVVIDPMPSDYISYTVTPEERHENPDISEADGEVSLGTIASLTGLTEQVVAGDDKNLREKYKVEISTGPLPRVKVWMADGGLFTRQNYNDTTLVVDRSGVFNVRVMACKDADSDGSCDYLDCALPVCSDGLDNDGDGTVDYAGGPGGEPADPGCADADDPSERGPANVNVCDDDQDNDGDGGTDYVAVSSHPNYANRDPECTSPLDDTEEAECADGEDNDGDGDIDFSGGPGGEAPDTGCTDENDNNEGDDPQCSDGINNDGDDWIDFDGGPDGGTPDPGCDSALDEDESDNPQCSDGIDNDLDGFCDTENSDCTDGTPGDRGCESIRDDNEQNIPIDRNIDIQKGARPQIIFQPRLGLDERLIIENPCPGNCLIQTFPDHRPYIGGELIADEPFTIIVAVLDTTDNTISYTIVAIGDYEEHSQLYRLDGLEYSGAVK